ncbi:hypothetical protein [Tunturiibacter gelidoferens]|jgi:hypothetical protein|uniref:Uncharacterized protein n=1 Tax=Tunturiibacter gelidiferens TaxID=3069689 RepID=A0ACC5NV03_9BACT|nr:hypothetical protein [Edaphobacter lichenicola]MBB5338397.1 hypothetical protein [Edaphobacter lichenicola]
MPAGRPQKIDSFTLYELARHFYGELKTLQDGLGWRIFLDRQKHEQLIREVEETSQLTAEALSRLERLLDLDIQRGFIPVSERSRFLDDMKKNIEFERRLRGLTGASGLSQKYSRIPGDPKIIDKLLNAKRPDQVRKICADAFAIYPEEAMPGEIVEVRRPNWPISQFSRLPDCLSQYASEFIDAKNDPRFPKSGRPTSRQKQMWFLSRALAGAVHGLSTRTSINLIGSVRPDEISVLTKISKRTRKPKESQR